MATDMPTDQSTQGQAAVPGVVDGLTGLANTGLLRLLQLTSANLPVGGFSFSQGLETACEKGWITNKSETNEWLTLQVEHSLTYLDLPILLRAHKAATERDLKRLQYWDDYLLACRETRELYLADTAMGQALRRLLTSLEIDCPLNNPCSFVTLFAIAAAHWRIHSSLCAYGFCWSWLENQVMAATKLVPLGQTQAQQLLGQLNGSITGGIAIAESLPDEALGASLPGLSIASCWHEHQYSRLFRS
ncbi:urease accessory protein UreF [Halioxenophilus aromaticivorans]|uniref:Urease accessory protein UreF n=1 Tax=Halioxenophilus aromaticivorans TaxID=1306992 RepID=A0AAV3U9R4_9ALTE